MILKFNVTGMTCAACSARVEKVSRAVPGVQKADVNLLAGTMVVSSDTDVSALVIQAVQKAGYNAVLQGTAAKKATASPMDTGLKEMKHRLIGSSIFLVVLMYFTMGHMVGFPVPGWYHGTQNAVVAALFQLCLTLPVVCRSVSYVLGTGTWRNGNCLGIQPQSLF